jgi:hypothetical protein
MRRTVKRTITIITTTHYTICWEANPATSESTGEPGLVILPQLAPVASDPPTKEPAKPIEEHKLNDNTNPDIDQPSVSFQSGEIP